MDANCKFGAKCAVALSAAGISAAALAGTCQRSFAWFKNNAVDNLAVPITLEEGKDGFSHADAADGIRVYDSDGTTLLAHEIESWNVAGSTLAWVKVPHFSKDTALTVKWGADAAGVEPSAESVWGEETRAVYHFAAASTTNSASGYRFNATVGNEASSRVDTPLGYAADFSAESSMRRTYSVPVSTFDGFTNNFTISMWIKPSDYKNGQYILQVGQGLAQKALLLSWSGSIGKISVYFYTDTYTGNYSSTTFDFPQDYSWHHFAIVKESGKVSWYLDGYLTESAADFDLKPVSEYPATAIGVAGTVTFGGNSGASNRFTGMLDELRFETVVRSADYIRALAETQSHGRSSDSLKYSFADLPDGVTLTNFPAFVSLDPSYPGYNGVNAYSAFVDGSIRVLDGATERPLPYELEWALNTAYARGVGFWVTFPELSNKSSLLLTASRAAYYTPGETESVAASSAATWDPNIYALTFHLNPTGRVFDAVTKQRLDPRWSKWKADGSGYENYDNNFRGVAPPAVGPTGPYAAMRSTTNAVQRNASFALSTPLTNVWTISWWSRVDPDEYANPKEYTYVWSVFGKAILGGESFSGNGCGPNKYVIYNNGGGNVTVDVPDTEWHHYAYTCDGKTTRSYRDGVLQKSKSGYNTFGFAKGSSSYVQLASSGNAYREALQGAMDEFRIETVCRDANWLRACWLTQRAWRDDGVAWQLQPHFAADGKSVCADGAPTVSCSLSCRTNANVTVCWGKLDRQSSADLWEHSQSLGECEDGVVSFAVPNLAEGERCFARFFAENEFGEVWSDAVHVRAPYEIPVRRGCRAKIAVNYDGAETLVDFPVCVRFPASQGLPADSSKLRIALDDAEFTPLACEIETWNPAGETVVWVRVPRLTPSTKLVAYWHDRLADDGEWEAADVWDPSFARVFHFNGYNVNGKCAWDSSENGGHVTVTYGVAPASTNGVVGVAMYADNSTTTFKGRDEGEAANDFRDGFTFEFWTEPDVVATTNVSKDAARIVAREELRNPKPSGFGRQYWIQYLPNSDAFRLEVYQYFEPIGMGFGTKSSELLQSLSLIPRAGDGWHHYAIVHDGQWLHTYRDGQSVNDVFWPFVLNEGTLFSANVRSSFWSNDNNNKYCGALDEYRFERAGRSAAWIKACYDNQKPNSEFVSVGATLVPGSVLIVR